MTLLSVRASRFGITRTVRGGWIVGQIQFVRHIFDAQDHVLYVVDEGCLFLTRSDAQDEADRRNALDALERCP